MFELEFACRFVDNARRYGPQVAHIGADERVLTEHVNYAGNSSRIKVEGIDGLGFEQRFGTSTGNPQPRLHIGASLLKTERRSLAAKCNALTELARKQTEGVRQADGRIAVEPMMDVDEVAGAIVHMASLPLSTNILTMTIMATNMPYIGRG